MQEMDIAVVGSGFSAAATVINLIESLKAGQSIAVIGRSSILGRGVAYSTPHTVHRLNVSACRMSLYADHPDHLCDWLETQDASYGREDYIPRSLYGRYVQETLASQFKRTDNSAQAEVMEADAIDCETLDDDRQVFHLSSGERIGARASVLCLGGTPAGLPIADSKIAREARQHICLNVWADPWMERAQPDDTVFMLGSGLTMIDQVMSLRERGHKGRIHVVSRHGLIPLPHLMPRSHPIGPVIIPGSAPLSQMMKTLRDAAADAPDWRGVVDGIRPVTQALWQNLSIRERGRFLRHANAWWNIHRHRLAPDTAVAFDEMRRSGQVTVSAGWLQEVYEHGGRARIAYKDRHTSTLRQVSANWLVNCTGMEKCSISKVPLLKKMSARGMLAADNLGLGVSVNSDSQIIRQDGSAARSSYALGPMTTGQFMEIFAVPDIRVQANKVAGRIAADLGAH
jgi:uncharacterized NAD(P)/FAD-binding protein YdhS